MINFTLRTPGPDVQEHNRSNYFNYINMTNADTSGMLRFLTDELQDAEDAGDRGYLLFFLARTGLSESIGFSLDNWPCCDWLGWHESDLESNGPL
jgi:hypothetical protein